MRRPNLGLLREIGAYLGVKGGRQGGYSGGNQGSTIMTPLSSFGLFAVTAMLIFYALESRSQWFILAFSGACALGSIYGFLQGAWPFGLIEAIWSLVALWKWISASA